MNKIDSRAFKPDYAHELAHIAQGRRCVAGVDEAGRGPWAGPVVAAAVVLDQAAIPDGLDDSKRLSAARRDALFEQIVRQAETAVVVLDARVIDEMNILQATMKAMAEAVKKLPVTPQAVLVDGNRLPVLSCPAEALVKGDMRSVSIAAASIVAKVTRDRMMIALDDAYPGYGFASHKGYGTRQHVESLEKLGPCAAHRRSFAPVKRLLQRL